MLAAVVAAALVVWPWPGETDSIETAEDLEAWILAHPDQASLAVLEGDAVRLAHRASEPRAVAGLTGLLLAAEYARQAEAGLDTTYQVAASALERLRLPGAESYAQAPRPLALPGLVRAAVRGDRPAADELLRVLGREGVESAPGWLRLSGVDAPLPVGGLLLAWAPAQHAEGTTPAQQTARFSRLPRAAQRDSAFARAQAYQRSPALRAGDRSRLLSGGLGLTAAETWEAAVASFPRGTAQAYGELLMRASTGRLVSPSVSARVRGALRGGDGAARTASGAAVGLAGSAALTVRGGQPVVSVLLLEGLPVDPEAQDRHARLAADRAARWAAEPGSAEAFWAQVNS